MWWLSSIVRQLTWVGGVCCMAVGTTAAMERPNIIVMMADDMGFSDIGCYGGEIETPHLDRLASQGLRFKQFYNGARCCPTRASLLTGLYAHQAGIGHMMTDRQLPGYQGDLNDQCVTIGQVLQSAGYATYMAGKWHVTKKIGPEFSTGDQRNWPRQRGFDRFFGTIHGAGSFFDPNSLTRNNRLIAPGSNDFYYTDAIAENAVRYIAEHDDRRPFFMYVAFTSPHWPMHAKPDDIQKYRGRYKAGWDRVRQTRLKRMVDMGLIDADWQLTERDAKAVAWDDFELQEWAQRRMEVYAAMVDCMDQAVGTIVQQLKRSGALDSTMIFFLADNGGCAEEFGSNKSALPMDLTPRRSDLGPMRPGELQTQMVPKRTRDGRVVRRGRGVIPGDADTYIAYGLEWANASNTPFRRYKHWVHEGGIASPLIVHWPEGIPTGQQGGWTDAVAHLIDIMPTVIDVADADYPEQYAGHPITRLTGTSLRPLFTSQAWDRLQPLFWEHEGNRAVRLGKWKLVAKGPIGPWELYDMETDRTETCDLSAQYPEQAAVMAEQWDTWAKSAQVVPWPWN